MKLKNSDNPDCSCYEQVPDPTVCCGHCDAVLKQYKSKNLQLPTGWYHDWYYFTGYKTFLY
jgi:hypothetical protein